MAYLRSSTGVAVFFSDVSDKAAWIAAGRCYERFALQATSMGIRNAFVNQPMVVTELRSRFAEAFGRADIELQPLTAINAVSDSLGHGEVPSRVVIDFGGA